MPAAYFVIRAIVTDASKRAAFAADFNRVWPEVKRSRERLVLAQEFVA